MKFKEKLEVLKKEYQRKKTIPSYEDMGKLFGISKSSVQWFSKKAQEEGYLEKITQTFKPTDKFLNE